MIKITSRIDLERYELNMMRARKQKTGFSAGLLVFVVLNELKILIGKDLDGPASEASCFGAVWDPDIDLLSLNASAGVGN